MLLRNRFWNIERELNKKNISIYEICRENNRFENWVHLLDYSDNFLDKINYLEKAHGSLKRILLMLSSKLNPTINPLISIDNEIHENYSILILRLDKLNSTIGKAKENLPLQIKNRQEYESYSYTNIQALQSFITILRDVLDNVIYLSIKTACDNISEEDIDYVPIKKEKEISYLEIKTDSKEILFYGLIYSYFLGNIQSITPIFSEIKPSESSLKTLSPESKEFLRLTQKKQGQAQNQPEGKKEENKPEGGEHGDTGDTEEPEE